MTNTVISVENLSKSYRLGAISGRTLAQDLNRWWARLRQRPDPYLKIGRVDSSQRPGEIIWALKDVSFTVDQGEVLGIIGRNGAGKSTLLKILSRVTAPTSGLVKVQGRIASLLEVGTGFHPELTGRENVYLNGAILGMSKDEVRRKFDEIVDFAGIEQFIDTPVKRYSSGMYVRLAFAVAAHLEPEILIVDEVLAVGDAEFQKKCLGKMRDVAGHGRTVLFVSHNMSAIENLCTSAILLRNGAIDSIGETGDIVQTYLAPGNITGGENDLAVTERIGAGNISFTRIRFLNNRNEEIEYGVTGLPLKIELVISSKGPSRKVLSRIGIGIQTSMGTPLFVCSTEMTEKSGVFISNNSQVVCEIPELPLTEGRYKIILFIEAYGVIEDWVKDGLELNVQERDFFGTGKNYPPGYQGKSVLVRHDWSFN